MEVLRKVSPHTGLVYRIYDNNPSYHIYEIERMIEYKDGVYWVPLKEPKNTLYTNLDDAIEALDKMIA